MAPSVGEERIASANGIEVAYQEIGDPGGTPLLMVMGLAAQMIAWDERFCSLLAEGGYRVIRFDNRDIGHSTKLTGAPVPGAGIDSSAAGIPAYGLEDMAADTVGLLDHLEIERAHVVGASMGGMISQIVAIEHPDRVASLCSIMSTTGDPSVGRGTPAALAALSQPPEPSREGYGEAAVRTAGAIGSPDFPADEQRLREFGRRS